MMLNFCAKNKSKYRAILKIFYVKQSIWLAEKIFGDKTQKLDCYTAWKNWINLLSLWVPTQLAFTCSKLTIETQKEGVKYFQSYQLIA